MLKKKTGYSKLMSRKTNQDHVSKGLSCALSWVFALVFFALIIFIIYYSYEYILFCMKMFINEQTNVRKTPLNEFYFIQ